METGLAFSDANVTNNHPILTGRIVLAHLKETLDYYIRLRVAEIEGDMLKAFVAKDPAKLMLKYQLWVTAKAELAERERAVAGATRRSCAEVNCHSRAQLGARQGAHGERLTRNGPSETIAPHNRSLVMDGHADDQSSSC